MVVSTIFTSELRQFPVGPTTSDLTEGDHDKVVRLAKLAKPLLITQLIFISLQSADLATTMLALHMGGVEKNSLVSHFMVIGSLQGLILSKVILLGIAMLAVRLRKYAVLRWANVIFSGVVLSNVVVIARLAFRSHVE